MNNDMVKRHKDEVQRYVSIQKAIALLLSNERELDSCCNRTIARDDNDSEINTLKNDVKRLSNRLTTLIGML